MTHHGTHCPTCETWTTPYTKTPTTHHYTCPVCLNEWTETAAAGPSFRANPRGSASAPAADVHTQRTHNDLSRAVATFAGRDLDAVTSARGGLR